MDQISTSNIWVQNGPINATNKISTGWHVSFNCSNYNFFPKIYMQVL